MLKNDHSDTPSGLLPQDWKLVSLGELEDQNILWIQNGYAQGSHNQAGVGVPHLRPFNVSPGGVIDLTQIKYVESPPEKSVYWVKAGDILFNNTNSEELVGKTAYFDLTGDYVLSNHMTIIRVIDESFIDKYWLTNVLYFSWLRGIFQAICRRHVNQASVSLARLREITIPLPPLPEQRAIAHVLTTVRQAIEATERVIAAARELKRSMMKHLFTYGPVPIDQVDQVVLKDTEIGEMPEDWEIHPLYHIKNYGGSIQTGPFGSLLHSSDYVPDGIPFVMPQDLSDDAKILTDKIARISKKDYERLDKYHLKSGDVVTARRGEIGRRALVTSTEDGWVCGTGCLRIRPGENLFPPFLSQSLGTPVLRNWLLNHSVGSTMANLSGRVLESLPFPFPDHITQQKIAEQIKTVEDKISAERNRRQALYSIFNVLLDYLMKGKLRVDLDTRYSYEYFR